MGSLDGIDDDVEGEWTKVSTASKSKSVSSKAAAVKMPAPIPRRRRRRTAPRTPRSPPMGMTSTPYTAPFGTPEVTSSKEKRAPAPQKSRTSPKPADKEVDTSVLSGDVGHNAAATLIGLQAQQFAYQYLVNRRPRKPFDGRGSEVDFEQFIKKFEAAIRTPGLTPSIKLAEVEFWFTSVAGIRVARFLLREDKEVALAEAIAMLKSEYGKRKSTPEEMLEDVMEGEKIPSKDLVAVDEFVAKLEAIYFLALDTDRAGQFDRKSLFESILANKLPQFKHKWIVKWSREELTDGQSLGFLDFIDYLKTAVRIARNVSRCDAATKDSKGADSATTWGRTTSSLSQSRRFEGGKNNPPFTKKSQEFESGKNYPPFQKKSQVSNGSAWGRPGNSRGSNIGFRLAAQAGQSLTEENVEVSHDHYCSMCEKPHILSLCPDFQALTADERSELCKLKNLCFKCLGADHQARNCASKTKCIDCGGNHHGILHGASVTGTNKDATSFVPHRTNFAVKPTPTASSSNQESA